MSFWSLFRKKAPQAAYRCPCCGQEYGAYPLCFGSDYPDYYFAIPPEEREQRIVLEQSLCVVDGEHFFHRCRLTIPIIDHSEDLVWNIWASISAENFDLRMDRWNDPNRASYPPYFGWLNSLVPTYGDTLNLPARAFEQPDGRIPSLEMLDEDHPLTIDQRQGITLKRALEIVEVVLRRDHGGGQ